VLAFGGETSEAGTARRSRVKAGAEYSWQLPTDIEI
jgi:hypothetical protein